MKRIFCFKEVVKLHISIHGRTSLHRKQRTKRILIKPTSESEKKTTLTETDIFSRINDFQEWLVSPFETEYISL